MSLTLIDKRTGEVTFVGKRVSRSLPCPICMHLHRTQSWCLVDSERQLAICPRVESSRKVGEAGWLHSMNNQAMTQIVASYIRKPEEVSAQDFGKRWQEARHRANDYYAIKLAQSLGLDASAIRSVPFGVEKDSWVFPMTDVSGKVIGLKVRTADGRKLCVKGSRLGLIVPESFNHQSDEIWLTEGESDLMAAISGWRVNAVARPGCTSCCNQVAQLAKRKHLIILADNDAPGKAGAARLVAACDAAKSVTVLTPPAKDVRAWVLRGATEADIRWRLKSRRGW